MASRVVLSHLTSLGLEQLVAKNSSHYIQLAVKYCEDREALLGIRAAILKAKKSGIGLFDSQGFVHKFMQGLQSTWERYESGLQPDHLNSSQNMIIDNSHIHSEL